MAPAADGLRTGGWRTVRKRSEEVKERWIYGAWALYFGAALLCQAAWPGGFRASFFAFPVNAALLLVGGVALWVLHRERPGSAAARLLAAPATTFLLIAVALATFLALGLVQRPAPASWWFFFLLSALAAHLFFVILRGLRRGRPLRLRFALNHVGLLFVLVGGFAGGADTAQWRVRVSGEGETYEAVAPDGGRIRLRQGLRLDRFTVAYDDRGVPECFEARIRVDGREELLRVNEPCALSWSDDLYLLDYERVAADEEPRYCILEVVRQPWKLLQRIGVWMLIAGAVLLFAQGGAPGGGASRRKGGEAK